MTDNNRLRSSSPDAKHYSRMNKVCLREQNHIWDQTNQIITRNHTIVRSELSQAKKIREKLETAVIQERAKIQSYKHLDEFNQRKLRGIQKYYNNFTSEHRYGNADPDRITDPSPEISYATRKSSAKPSNKTLE